MGYAKLASQEIVLKTIGALKPRGAEGLFVGTGKEAFEKIKSFIPKGASVNNGSSTTLIEIGYIDYLMVSQHGWVNLHGDVLNEKDMIKQEILRKKSFFPDYYLGSVHAITESGQMVFASASGSQLPLLAHTAKNIILIVGAQKIVPDLDTAFKRIKEYIYPLEDKRMKSIGAPGTSLSKILIFEKEPDFMGRSVKVIFVNEKLGF